MDQREVPEVPIFACSLSLQVSDVCITIDQVTYFSLKFFQFHYIILEACPPKLQKVCTGFLYKGGTVNTISFPELLIGLGV